MLRRGKGLDEYLPNFSFLQARLAKFVVSTDSEFVQAPLAQITWYRHISMLPKIKDLTLRAFYMTEASIQGWSRDIMMMQIEDGYHKKAVALPNNFDTTRECKVNCVRLQ